MINLQKKIRYFVSHSIVKYYLKHPLILLRNRIIFLFLWVKKISHKDINFNNIVRSKLPIDIVLTAVDKDYDVLVYVIDSIKKYLMHPIGKIIIISPKSRKIIDLCNKNKCYFVDENTVLPITKKDIDYKVNSIDRSGWLFQQLLKYAAEKYCTNQYYLVTEADTVFLRPRIFEKNNKILLPCSHQLCHIPYFNSYKEILGKGILPLVNFTTHHTLINKIILNQLKLEIEQNCKKIWYKAIIENIDKTEGSAISDYETYGQYLYNNYMDKIQLEDWANISLKRSSFSKINLLLNKLYKNYKTVSFQSYNK